MGREPVVGTAEIDKVWGLFLQGVQTGLNEVEFCFCDVVDLSGNGIGNPLDMDFWVILFDVGYPVSAIQFRIIVETVVVHVDVAQPDIFVCCGMNVVVNTVIDMDVAVGNVYRRIWLNLFVQILVQAI